MIDSLHLYISGPIASEPKGLEYAKERFALAKVALNNHYREVTNPFDIAACADSSCVLHELARRYPSKRDFAVQTGLYGEHTWDCYLRYDLAAMLLCDGVATLTGWEASPGARLEVTTAIKVGLPIRHIEEWMAQDES